MVVISGLLVVMLQATVKGGVIHDYLRCFKDTQGTAGLLKVI